MPHVLINRVPIYYEQSGTGENHIVFIHGMGLSHTNWIEQVTYFQNKARLLTYDLRGHGRSGCSLPDQRSECYIDLLVRDLFGLLEHLNIKKALLVGYSSGTIVSLQFMIRYPDKVWGAILSGAFGKISNLYLKSKILGSYWLGQVHLKNWLASQVARSNGATAEQIQLFLHEANKVRWNEARLLLKDCLSFNILDRLPEMSTPTLLIYGGKEKHMMEYRHQLLTKLPNAEVCLIPEIKHACPTKGKEFFNQLADTFFQRHKPNPSSTAFDANQNEGDSEEDPQHFAERYFIGDADQANGCRGNQNHWTH